MKSLRETCAPWLERNRPTTPERAAWSALDDRQKLFILRGLGLNPHTFAMERMTNHERVRLMNCIKAWAGTAERLQSILGTCRAEQQAEWLRLVDPVSRPLIEDISRPLIDAMQTPDPKEQRKEQAA